MSYVPEDRQRMGLALGATVAENANAGRDDRGFARGPFLDRHAMADFARRLIERYRIRAGGHARAGPHVVGRQQAEAGGRPRTCRARPR